VASLASVLLGNLISKEIRSKLVFLFIGNFVFDINGYLDRPNTIDSSIVKSFHWVEVLMD